MFPGSNCDSDCKHALNEIDGFKVSMLWHKEVKIPDKTDLVILPGGFSYGDYLRCGAIAAKSPIMSAVNDFYLKGGFILGICNGFQVLTETNILPGALITNRSQKFICKEEEIIVQNSNTVFTSLYENNQNLSYPIAHHDGQYFIDKNGLSELIGEERIAFKYKSNPNGSIDNIAGILSKNKRVLGLMPHPERAIDKDIGNTSGIKLFKSLLQSIR